MKTLAQICFLVLLISIVNCEYTYETKWFKVPLDHFGFQRTETFQIKYLVNENYWNKGNGPIFFYTGNEGQIELFAKNTGFMWEIAEQFKAKIVFAEHRYYGASMPFGNKSLDNEHIGYLTSEQALADYADLINYLQEDALRPKYPVIAFGGSYGGMLAAYFRIKYPHIVNGAIAASAPIHMYSGMVPCEAFHVIVTSNFKGASITCAANIRQSWSVIRNFTTSNNTDWLQKNWNLCDPVKNATDQQHLLDFLENMYVTLAMVNYPFASDFIVPLPALPVEVVCQYLNQPLNDKKLLEGIGKILQVFTNTNNSKSKCVDYKQGDNIGNLDANGWDFQACTEMVMPVCKTGVTDMFEPKPWNFSQYSEECYKKYKVYPRQDEAKITYGGKNLGAASNIVFSNGVLDPWSVGGVLNSVTDSVVAVIMQEAAHHLDLMPSNPADPDSVKSAREVHKQNIAMWIQKFNEIRTRDRPYL